jgi:hypothetical protein
VRARHAKGAYARRFQVRDGRRRHAASLHYVNQARPIEAMRSASITTSRKVARRVRIRAKTIRTKRRARFAVSGAICASRRARLASALPRCAARTRSAFRAAGAAHAGKPTLAFEEERKPPLRAASASINTRSATGSFVAVVETDLVERKIRERKPLQIDGVAVAVVAGELCAFRAPCQLESGKDAAVRLEQWTDSVRRSRKLPRTSSP